MQFKHVFKLFLILIVTLFAGWQTQGPSNADTIDASKQISKGSSGKLKYKVLRNIDLTDIINGTAKNAEQEEIYAFL